MAAYAMERWELCIEEDEEGEFIGFEKKFFGSLKLRKTSL